MFEWFKTELKTMMPGGDLRLVRDPHRLGFDLWAVERKLPAAEHAAGLEQLRLAGEDRFIEVEIPGIGIMQYDCAPEWHVVHICKSSTCPHTLPQYMIHFPECYREPNATDLLSLRKWLFEFRDFEHSRQVLAQEAKEREEANNKKLNYGLRKEIKSSKKFRGLVYSMPGDGTGSTTERINE